MLDEMWDAGLITMSTKIADRIDFLDVELIVGFLVDLTKWMFVCLTVAVGGFDVDSFTKVYIPVVFDTMIGLEVVIIVFCAIGLRSAVAIRMLTSLIIGVATNIDFNMLVGDDGGIRAASMPALRSIDVLTVRKKT